MNGWLHLYFQWPWALLLLLLLPLWFAAYLKGERKRWQQALRFSYASVIEHLKLNPSMWKRLAFPLTCLAVAVCLILALARPTVVQRVPTRAMNLMLVLDISLSMMANDISPSRLQAAKEAGIHFVESLPSETRLGLELFAGNTYVVSPPIADHEKIIAYLKSLKTDDLQEGTAIGDAIQGGVKALALSENKQAKPPQRLMVLMSDGDNKLGYPVPQAALNAKKENVIIDTIGIGSLGAADIQYHGQSLPVSFDEADLRQVAQLSGGRYFRVADAKDFGSVYQDIQDNSIEYDERPVDMGYIFSGVALLILLLGSSLYGFRMKRFP